MAQSIPGAFAMVDVLSHGTTEPALLLTSVVSGDTFNTYLRWNKLDEATKTTVATVMAAVSTAGSATNVLWANAYRDITVTGTGITANAATGLVATTTYGLTVTPDGGTPVVISILGSAAATFQQLIDDVLAPALDGVATVSWVQTNATTGAIRFTGTKFTAALGSMAVAGSGTSLITAIDGTAAWAAVVSSETDATTGSSNISFPVTYLGAARADWKAALGAYKVGSASVLDLFATTSVVTKNATTSKPASKAGAVRTHVYYDGTDWKYFDNDTAVGGTGTTTTPPESV